jgi:hypothetical protein
MGKLLEASNGATETCWCDLKVGGLPNSTGPSERELVVWNLESGRRQGRDLSQGYDDELVFGQGSVLCLALK